MKLSEAIRVTEQRIKQIDVDIYYANNPEFIEVLEREKDCLQTLLINIRDLQSSVTNP